MLINVKNVKTATDNPRNKIPMRLVTSPGRDDQGILHPRFVHNGGLVHMNHDTLENLHKKSLHQELTPEEKLTLFIEYAGKIANESKLNNLLMLMADLGRKLISADRCTLWLYDPQAEELWTKVAHGIQKIHIPADSGMVGHVIKTRKPYYVDDAYHDPHFNKEVDQRTGYRSKAMLAVPLFDNDGEIFGAYQAVNKTTASQVFSESDIDQLTMIGSYSAKSIVNVMLNDEIEKTQKEIIFLMGEIGEKSSQETSEHIKRVAKVSKKLALLSGMDEEEAELVKMASPMHDIGKVAIPDAIINKPGKLTDDEFNIIKTHTTIGYQLLKNSNRRILKASAIIAHQHHEKWNGKGYPDGLKGEEIHPYGRIIAIADVLDALVSERCYKTPWDLDRVYDLFQTEKGQHFDPDMTQIFLDHFSEFISVLHNA